MQTKVMLMYIDAVIWTDKWTCRMFSICWSTVVQNWVI